MFTNVAHSITREFEEKPILARMRPDFDGFLVKVGESNVPTAFLNAYAKLVNRLTREGKIRGQGELYLLRATPVWKQIAKELFEFDFHTPELARLCVSYVLNIATAKSYLENYFEYQEGVNRIRREFGESNAEAQNLLSQVESQYPDTGDLFEALFTKDELAEAKLAFERSNRLMEELSKHEARDGVVSEKLKASSILCFVWHEKRVLEISPKHTWYGRLIDMVKRGIYKLPTRGQYDQGATRIEEYFGSSVKRGRILHRAQ